MKGKCVRGCLDKLSKLISLLCVSMLVMETHIHNVIFVIFSQFVNRIFILHRTFAVIFWITVNGDQRFACYVLNQIEFILHVRDKDVCHD